MQRSQRVHLLDPALHAAIQQHVLEGLTALELGRLAATCTSLHALVASADAQIWRAAASHSLPHSHPALLSDSTPAICEALRQQALAHRNIKLGVCGKSPDIRAALQPMLSPCGNRVAVLSPRPWPVLLGGAQCWLEVRDAMRASKGLMINLQAAATADPWSWVHQVDMRWSADGASIVVAQHAGNQLLTVKVFDARSGEELQRSSLQLPPTVWAFGGSMSPHGTFFVKCNQHPITDLMRPSLWLALTSTGLQEAGSVLTPRHNVHVWHPTHEGLLAMVFETGKGIKMNLLDLHNQAGCVEGPELRENARVICCAWSLDGARLAYARAQNEAVVLEVIGRADGLVKWSTAPACSVPSLSMYNRYNSALAFSCKGHLAFAEGSTLRVYKTDSQQALCSIVTHHDAIHLHFSPDGETLLANNTQPYGLSIIDTASWQVLPLPRMLTCSLECLDWSCTGTRLICQQRSMDYQHMSMSSSVFTLDWVPRRSGRQHGSLCWVHSSA